MRRNPQHQSDVSSIEADVVIVGSGAGGATIAKELAEKGRNILILEKGKDLSFLKINTGSHLLKRALVKHHERRLLSSISQRIKNLILKDKNIPVGYRIGVGGTTTVASANAVRSLEKEMKHMGISLEDELDQVEKELKVTPFPQRLMGKGALKLLDAADSLGLKMEPMPKFIDFSKCQNCERCDVNCKKKVKWTAVDFIKEAQKKGALLLQDVAVEKVLNSNGRAIGVEAKTPLGKKDIRANIVVLAAGAIGTPIILRKSGIESAGKKIFCDPYYILYGPSKTGFYSNEPRAIVNFEFLEKEGFIFMNHIVSRSLKNFRYPDVFFKSNTAKGLLAIMIKIKDEAIGYVFAYDRIKKSMSLNDLSKLTKSIPIAREILIKAGVDHKHIRIKGPAGAHPGGTAAIGDVVDINQETEIKNLFISDASVLPASPGLPPMLTIAALSKRLARKLSKIST